MKCNNYVNTQNNTRRLAMNSLVWLQLEKEWGKGTFTFFSIIKLCTFITSVNLKITTKTYEPVFKLKQDQVCNKTQNTKSE